MPEGYCTLEDLRRALREKNLPGDLSQDTQIAVDAITAQTEWLEKSLSRHWYEPNGITEATQITIPSGPRTRDDEEDIPTNAGLVAGETPVPKTVQGDYAEIRLARRDAEAVNKLLVRTGDGSYEDWVASADYTGGSYPGSLGDDYYLRVNNGGWSILYIDTTNLLKDGETDEYVLDSFARAAYVEYSYGHEGIPRTIRRAVAFRAASDFVNEAAIQIPENARIGSVESLAEQFERKAEELLEVYQ